MLCRDTKERQGGSAGAASTLLPAFDSAFAHADEGGELATGEFESMSNVACIHVRYDCLVDTIVHSRDPRGIYLPAPDGASLADTRHEVIEKFLLHQANSFFTSLRSCATCASFRSSFRPFS